MKYLKNTFKVSLVKILGSKYCSKLELPKWKNSTIKYNTYKEIADFLFPYYTYDSNKEWTLDHAQKLYPG